MKRLRIDRFSNCLVASRPGVTLISSHLRAIQPAQRCLAARWQSTVTANEAIYNDGTNQTRFPPLERITETTFSYPSPDPDRALSSAKLAALHARLSLPERLSRQTLARALVDASADENPNFNNSNLALLGQTLINYHVAEWLMCRYPRLPMSIFYEAMRGFAGTEALYSTAQSWGIEAAAAPGGEVDPGLLQYSVHKMGVSMTTFGSRRTEAQYLEKFKWRRGISSRVVFDDDFGDQVNTALENSVNDENGLELEAPSNMSYGSAETRKLAEKAYANAVRATVGGVYAHCGRERVKAFIQAHILSRTLDLSNLFSFTMPTRELSLLCAREDFESPVARILSETGRLSRTPVFVVGIFSGKDKLGEGAGPNLDYARNRAAMNALKAWYLYSPGETVRLPSDMLVDDAKPWEPVYIDMGEIISR
jgi:dsRNA-specific ribonuclease